VRGSQEKSTAHDPPVTSRARSCRAVRTSDRVSFATRDTIEGAATAGFRPRRPGAVARPADRRVAGFARAISWAGFYPVRSRRTKWKAPGSLVLTSMSAMS
jgi:hypothetical protein